MPGPIDGLADVCGENMEFLALDEMAFESFVAQYPPAQPVVMLNLLKFRDEARYPQNSDYEPCSGAEAFARYGEAVLPMIARSGGRQIWQGQQAAMLIGPQDKQWSLAVLVEYPSARAFLDMISSDEYQQIVVHRVAALEDARLIAHKPL
ncbi:MAG: DUF1330 domain-containing protein [Pseudomonadota bacterium]